MTDHAHDPRRGVTGLAAAVAEALIPADEDAGGIESGAGRYLIARLESDEDPWLTEATLQRLDAEAGAQFGGASFGELSPRDRATVIANLERGKSCVEWPLGVDVACFMRRLIALTHQGFYGDPANGGNDDAVSWHMLGYSSGIPGRP